MRRFGCACLLPLLLLMAACTTVPRFPARGELAGEKVSTTVDSEVARYYLEHYLHGNRLDAVFDTRIDGVYRQQGAALPTRDDLAEIARDFSVDFAALFFADRLWSQPANRTAQSIFNGFLADDRSSDISAALASRYLALFVPGWNYVKNAHLTGADFAAPRRLVGEFGVENRLVVIPPTGSVEDNARLLSQEIAAHAAAGKEIIVVGASSAGPAIHLSLAEQLTEAQRKSVKAWINVGGLLQGTPLIDYMQEWPRRWLFDFVLWWENWDKKAVLSMSAARSRERFARLALDPDLLVINYVGVSLSGQLSVHSQDKYPILARSGPNDGLTLLPDIIAPGSITIIAPGSDHFFAEDPRIHEKTVAMLKTVIRYLAPTADRRGSPSAIGGDSVNP